MRIVVGQTRTLEKTMCLNDLCDKDPLRSPDAICVTIDGDFVCSQHCKKEHEKQKATFFSETIHDDAKFRKWLGA